MLGRRRWPIKARRNIQRSEERTTSSSVRRFGTRELARIKRGFLLKQQQRIAKNNLNDSLMRLTTITYAKVILAQLPVANGGILGGAKRGQQEQAHSTPPNKFKRAVMSATRSTIKLKKPQFTKLHTLTATHTYTKPGRCSPALRVASHRRGDTRSWHARVENLGRVRVVVS